MTYFDLTKTDPGGVIELDDIEGFGRDAGLSATDAACSLIIVIEGGSARLNSELKAPVVRADTAVGSWTEGRRELFGLRASASPCSSLLHDVRTGGAGGDQCALACIGAARHRRSGPSDDDPRGICL